jgi:hypothetical protein
VNAGGPDACIAFGFEHPGCDGNFSLVAKEYADGSVSGQFTDRFANGNGFHAEIDCLVVNGNEAWISGVITEGKFDDFDFTGLSVNTRVRDNGTSANDPADQISISWIGDDFTCKDQRADVLSLFDTPEGQVKVK